MNNSKLNITCYDNGGETADRYTIVNIDDLEHITADGAIYGALSASEHPFHPLGFGQHTSAMMGEHLGQEIAFETLPEEVQRFVAQNLG
jgi:hypothetical protein